VRFPRTIAFPAQEASDTNGSVRADGGGEERLESDRYGRVPGGVPAGFSAWLSRAPSRRTFTAERIESKVARFHGDSDEVSRSPKILADLRCDTRSSPVRHREDDGQAASGGCPPEAVEDDHSHQPHQRLPCSDILWRWLG
jgi:hypothetical protein